MTLPRRPHENDPRLIGADYWGEDEKYPVEYWQWEVSNGDTRLGYWDWVVHQKKSHEL